MPPRDPWQRVPGRLRRRARPPRPAAPARGTQLIGWYVHHHGRGHLHRARAIGAHLAAPPVLLGSVEGADVRLPPDTDREGHTPPVLHWAPRGSAGLRARMAAIAGWLEAARPALVVVDVSVEVALLVRLHGVAVVVMRQHGRREDAAHRLGHAVADRFLAPWPAWLEQPGLDPDVLARTFHAGGFSRFDGRDPGVPAPGTGLLLQGGGGHDAALADALRTAVPDRTWTVLGPGAWSDDPWPALTAAEVVVCSAGHNAVMEVAAARRPLVVVPEPRPFDEQAEKAAALHRTGVAVDAGSGPDRDWPALVQRALVRGARRQSALVDGDGARRAAAFLEDLERVLGPGHEA